MLSLIVGLAVWFSYRRYRRRRAMMIERENIVISEE